ncbi:MAG: AbrB/MazE/SpoVT family DNA-binding domain-containing protein [Proteobacteria bacterium]|nr:AbrB/MazE/SpoVT family DNA-binding domain-containing protein [Pseudomonadota bacterium]
MLMKVFNKGQIVIPIAIRKALGVEPGDMMDVIIDEDEQCIKLKKLEQAMSPKLAGSLSRFNKRKSFPTKKEMKKALAEGLSDGR